MSPTAPAGADLLAGGTVLVLAGGLSAEREVSMRSGERIVGLLGDSGVNARLADAEPDVMGQLVREDPTVVWPTLHGAGGEDGSLAEMLRLLRLPVVGSSPEASRLAWDKSVAASVAQRDGVAVPESVTVSADLLRDVGAHRLLGAVLDQLGGDLVVKPKRGGSGFGVSVVHESSGLADAVVGALGHDSSCRIEKYVPGCEVTVTIVDGEDGPRACPPIELEPLGHATYDFAARYTLGATEFHVPARLGADVLERLTSGALAIHERLGLGSVSRSDWRVDESGRPWFIEVNTSPGMTATSTSPLAMAALGDLSEVVTGLARAARPR